VTRRYDCAHLVASFIRPNSAIEARLASGGGIAANNDKLMTVSGLLFASSFGLLSLLAPEAEGSSSLIGLVSN